MTILVTGGSKCGKSALAERFSDGFCGEKIYMAAMQPYGEEAAAAISRHRKMREGKGFYTLEKYTDIHEADIPARSFVLLECMGNLLANEMFRDGRIYDPVKKIVSGADKISKQAELFVIVTNQVGDDGIEYSPETNRYISALGRINSIIAANSDTVIECVYGIPVLLKGKMP